MTMQCVCSLLLLAGSAAAAADEARVKRSDVVFMGAKTPDVYAAYGATMVSWGGGAGSDDEKAVAGFRQRVKDAHDLGLRYCAGLAFRTAFARMIDFDPKFLESVCRTLDGEPILVPWLWDHKHKGHPAYWFCTNAPGYRAYLRHQARLALQAGVEGLHIDDYNGTAGTEWRGGCFCAACTAGFRDYLKAHVPAARLKECGVDLLEGFDYGRWLKARGVTTEQYRKSVDTTLPLGPEFVTFQYHAAAEWIGEIRRYAEELAGRPLMLSVNSAGSSPKSLVIAPQLTYFCGEVGHQAASRALPAEPIFVFKMGDALDRAIACTASGQDWAYVMEQKLPGLVRAWIAQSYAFGHQLMAPHRQWAYTEQKGTHWYQSEPKEYAHLYQFVRRHADLFDGYDALAPVGLLYSNAALRKGKRAVQEACAALARQNVPFRLLVAGDDWLPNRLTREGLAGLQSIVVTEPLELDAAQQAVLDGARDRVITWPARPAAALVRVAGAEKITVVPRAVPGDAARPFVCHLVNGNYDGQTDRMVAQRGFTVSLSRALFGGAGIAKATLYAPEREPVSVPVARAGDAYRITVPELDLWGVVKLEREGR